MRELSERPGINLKNLALRLGSGPQGCGLLPGKTPRQTVNGLLAEMHQDGHIFSQQGGRGRQGTEKGIYLSSKGEQLLGGK